MGLDSVELLLRCEEFLSISVADDEARAVRTVRDLYHLICTKLDITPSTHLPVVAEPPVIATYETKFRIFRSDHQKLPVPPELLPWTGNTVWQALVAILVDQLSLDPEAILPDAEIVRDLGVD